MTSSSEASSYRAGARGTLCQFCASTSFRRSRLQPKDVFALLIMRYPVRCLSCSKRQVVSMFTARRAVSSAVKKVRASRSGELHESSRPLHDATPLTVNGQSFSALTIQAPVVMPELKGVASKYHDAAKDRSRIA